MQSLISAIVVLLSIQNVSVGAFAPQNLNSAPTSTATSTSMKMAKSSPTNAFSTVIAAGLIGTSILFPGSAFADEIGVEKEAPTLFTGETTQVRIRIKLTNRIHWVTSIDR